MSNNRVLRPSLALLLAGTALALLAVHTIAYLVHATPTGLADALHDSGHGAWSVVAAGVLVVIAIGGVLVARSRSRFAHGAERPGRRSFAREFVVSWALISLAAAAGFLAIETVERALGGTVVEHSPVTLLAHLPTLALGLAATGLIAAGVMAAAHAGQRDYARVLTDSYAQLTADGTYTSTFRQSGWAESFVRSVLDREAPSRHDRPLTVLEAGCGSGPWLAEIAAWASERGRSLHLAGFDLSPDMVREAAVRLAELGVDAGVRVGDVLDPASYAAGGTDAFDIVMAYDVVQQLPAGVQRRAVDTLLQHVAPGGRLIVFDHDRQSRYGRIMGTKKALRRYLGLPLVPRYYIHARYPDLERIAASLRRTGLHAVVQVEEQGRKRVLVVRVPDGRRA